MYQPQSSLFCNKRSNVKASWEPSRAGPCESHLSTASRGGGRRWDRRFSPLAFASKGTRSVSRTGLWNSFTRSTQTVWSVLSKAKMSLKSCSNVCPPPTITIYRKISVSLASRLVVSQMTSPQRLPRDKATGQCPSRTFLSHLNFALASDRLNSAYLATACSRLEGLASFLEKSLRSFLGDNGRFFPSHDERKVCEPKLLRSACTTQHL